MRILATAIHDEVTLDAHIFRLYLALTPLTKGDEKNFLGKLASNFKRNEYVLYDHELTNKASDKDKILANIHSFTDQYGKKAM